MEQRVIQPQELFADYFHNNTDGKGEHNKLGSLEIRETPERQLDLTQMVHHILSPEEGVVLDSADISSIILWGSSVNKSPYSIIRGATHQFSIPFFKKKFHFKEADRTEYIPVNDVDICVITSNSYRGNAKNQVTLRDIDYFNDRKIEGNLDIHWVSEELYLQHLRNGGHFAKKVLEDGLPIVDNGFFQNIIPVQSRDLYALKWFRKDILYATGFLGSTYVQKEDARFGKLVYLNPNNSTS